MLKRPANITQLTSRLKLNDNEAKILTHETLAFLKSKYTPLEEREFQLNKNVLDTYAQEFLASPNAYFRDGPGCTLWPPSQARAGLSYVVSKRHIHKKIRQIMQNQCLNQRTQIAKRKQAQRARGLASESFDAFLRPASSLRSRLRVQESTPGLSAGRGSDDYNVSSWEDEDPILTATTASRLDYARRQMAFVEGESPNILVDLSRKRHPGAGGDECISVEEPGVPQSRTSPARRPVAVNAIGSPEGRTADIVEIPDTPREPERPEDHTSLQEPRTNATRSDMVILHDPAPSTRPEHPPRMKPHHDGFPVGYKTGFTECGKFARLLLLERGREMRELSEQAEHVQKNRELGISWHLKSYGIDDGASRLAAGLKLQEARLEKDASLARRSGSPMTPMSQTSSAPL